LFFLPPHPQVFNLPESQVVLCGVDKLSKGEAVFCVYPDTTSFYQATVVQAPRKNQANTGSGSFVMVNFVDDSDEFGVTHDKAVPLRHVIYPPYGATTNG
jgi:SGF29 tudor-like domain